MEDVKKDQLHCDMSCRNFKVQNAPLFLSKRRVEPDIEKKGLDYGKILLTFVNPANPYSWFLYMLGFIIVYGTVSGN